MKKAFVFIGLSSSFFYFSCETGNPTETPKKIDVTDSAQQKIIVTSTENTTTAFGIDISKYQGSVIKEIGPEDHLAFIICKATEGITYTDPDFSTNWTEIKSKGLIRGSYHFYKSNDDPVKQAQFFVQTLVGLNSDDLPPVLDVEEGSLVGTVNTSSLQKDLITFLTTVERLCKRKPILYTDLHFANKYLNTPSFSTYPLWLAEYSNTEKPKLPVAWQINGYIIWQKSDAYDINSDTTDFDSFNGNKKELLEFIKTN